MSIDGGGHILLGVESRLSELIPDLEAEVGWLGLFMVQRSDRPPFMAGPGLNPARSRSLGIDTGDCA